MKCLSIVYAMMEKKIVKNNFTKVGVSICVDMCSTELAAADEVVAQIKRQRKSTKGAEVVARYSL